MGIRQANNSRVCRIRGLHPMPPKFWRDQRFGITPALADYLAQASAHSAGTVIASVEQYCLAHLCCSACVMQCLQRSHDMPRDLVRHHGIPKATLAHCSWSELAPVCLQDPGLAPNGPLMASHGGHVHKCPVLDALPWMLMPNGLALQLPERR